MPPLSLRALSKVGCIFLITFSSLLIDASCVPAPPTRLAGDLDFDLNEVARQVGEDGTLNLLDSLSRDAFQNPFAITADRDPHSAPPLHVGNRDGPSTSVPSQHGHLPVFQTPYLSPYQHPYIPTGYNTPELVPVPWQQFHQTRDQSDRPTLRLGFGTIVDGWSDSMSQQHLHDDSGYSLAALPGSGLHPVEQSIMVNSDTKHQFQEWPGSISEPKDLPLSGNTQSREETGLVRASSKRSQKGVVGLSQNEDVAGPSSSQPSVTAPPLADNEIALPTHLRNQESYETQTALAPSEESNAETLPYLTDAQVRQQAVHSPVLFSGLLLSFVMRPDPAVNRLISELRSTGTNAEHVSGSQVSGSGVLVGRETEDATQVARRYFWVRKEAKQVLLRDPEGTRSLLFIDLTNQAFMLGRPNTRHVGVWEIGRSLEDPSLALFFRGFFPFSGADYRALGSRLPATNRKYWLILDRRRSRISNNIIALDITTSRDYDDPFTLQLDPVLEQLRLDPALEQIPAIQDLLETGELRQALLLSALLPGKHAYIYKETERTKAFIELWKAEADLSPSSFEPIELAEQQIDYLGMNIVDNYRKVRAVKVITESSGETLVLTYFSRLRWIAGSNRDIVLIFEIGPKIHRRRLMMVRGFFHTSARMFQRMTPVDIPGLRDSSFQYNYDVPP